MESYKFVNSQNILFAIGTFSNMSAIVVTVVTYSNVVTGDCEDSKEAVCWDSDEGEFLALRDVDCFCRHHPNPPY